MSSMISNDRTPALNSHHKNNTSEQLYYKHLPAFAKYLLENKLDEFTKAQLNFSKEIKLPLLKHLQNLGEQQLLAIGAIDNRELLSYCAENKAELYIQESIEKWLNNQLPFISKSQLVAEDIALFNLMRRNTLRHFLRDYTNDNILFENILKEIDLFSTRIEAAAINAYFEMQRQLFQQAQSLSRIGNWQLDLKTQQLFWSDEIYHIYEIEPQSPLVLEDIYAYNHPADKGIVDRHLQYSMQTQKPNDFFYRIILKDGREKILHATGEIKLDNKGDVIELFGTLQDVTKEKQKENELDANRRFIEKITDISPCIISVYNVKAGNYIYVNKGVETILSYTPEDFYKKGRTFFYELVHDDDAQFLKQKNETAVADANLQRTDAKEQITEFRYRLKHKNNTYRWIQTFTTVFSRDKDDKVLEMLNVSIDVTENQLLTLQLEQINEEIKFKELQHQRMISEVEDYAILLLDKEGFIQNWNKGAEKIKGYTASDIIGKNFRVFYRKEDVENKLPDSLLKEAAEKGRAQHEGWRIRKDGTAFWGNVVITALHDENKNLIGFSKVTRNLTEKKLAEDKLKAYASEIEKHNEELQRINKELDSFTYMASHDLQEPLRKIRTFCNIILNRSEESLQGDIKNYFDRIIISVNRMQTLIDSLLNYSRAATTEIVLQPVDLNSIIDDVKKDLAEVIEEKNVTITCSDLPILKVEPLQFHQLFFNLVENAIKYKRDDVPPAISIDTKTFWKENDDAEKIKFYRITVKDNGIGFEQQYADNIFKLFQRLHGRSEYSGTGIGLAICKKIVENHTGTIKAIGEPGKGSAFIIELPSDTEAHNLP